MQGQMNFIYIDKKSKAEVIRVFSYRSGLDHTLYNIQSVLYTDLLQPDGFREKER